MSGRRFLFSGDEQRNHESRRDADLSQRTSGQNPIFVSRSRLNECVGDYALTQNGALVKHHLRHLLFPIEHQCVRLAVTRLLDGHRQRVQVGRKRDPLRVCGLAVDLVGYFQSMVAQPVS